MRVVFFGTPRIAVPALETLLTVGHEVPLLVCQPDRPAGRSARPVAPPTKVVAASHGLRVTQPTGLRSEDFRSTLAACAPDLLVVVAYGRILPEPVLSIAPHGAINVHFSLLPKYRGAAPVQWALARGEEITGVTSMLLNQKMDEGDVLLQREVAIESGEHCPELQERLSRIGAALLARTLDDLTSGCLTRSPQHHSLATFAPLLKREDGEADPNWTADQIEGRIRGFDPWPGVWLQSSGRRVRIVRGRACPGAHSIEAPGRVLGIEGEGIRVACGGGTVLEVLQLQPEGRRRITAREAWNGRLLESGGRLEGRTTSA